MILAGDIGGTNTRLAFFEGTADRLTPLAIEVFPSGAHKGPEEIARKFLAKHKHTVDAACFGIAGAVVDGRVETPNLPWQVNERDLAAELHLDHVELINDLLANAHGIALLDASDFVVLNPGQPGLGGNRALISAGTGLGEAGLLAESSGYRPFPSEGGDMDFAPRNELELDMLRFLMDRFNHVSYERVLSGPALFNIYPFPPDPPPPPEPPYLADHIAQGHPAARLA